MFHFAYVDLNVAKTIVQHVFSTAVMNRQDVNLTELHRQISGQGVIGEVKHISDDVLHRVIIEAVEFYGFELHTEENFQTFAVKAH